ncbi:MAG: hypothetical protein ACYDD7_18240 [Acidimicrobiales bacterium]
MTRAVSSALAVTVAAVVVGAAPAGAATNGVGTTSTKTSVLTLALGQNGSLLSLGLLTDASGVNTDSHGGSLQAATALVPVTLSVPALHHNLSTPPITTLSPGGQSDANSQALTLAGLGVPAALATATVKPAALHSEFVNGAAHATMTAAEIDNIGLVGGALASIDLLASKLGANAIGTQADGARGVDVGSVNLLDLGALLRGIGADLATLPLSGVSGMITKLGVSVPGLTAGSSLSDQVTSLNSALADLRKTLVNASTSITQPVDAATGNLLKGLNLQVPTAGTLVTDVNGVITTVTDTLANLVKSAVTALDSFPLVKITGAQFGITTKAADTVGNSAAAVGLSPLSVTVAGVKLPSIDFSTAVNTVNGVIAQGNTLLNGVLAPLGLSNLLSLSLLQQAHNVSQTGSYTTATAGLSVLDLKFASLDPTVVLSAISKLAGPSVGSLVGATPLGSLLSSSNSMGALNALLGQSASLLNGGQIQIASLAGSSTYTFASPTAAKATPTQLPHTGGSPQLAIIGVLATIAGLGAFRWRRMNQLQLARMTVPSDRHS